MKLLNEDQLLDKKFRAAVIEDIKSSANQARRQEARKRSEVDQDNTVKYVMEKLQREGMAGETLAIMENRAANISICKKIINKLARVYAGSVSRTTSDGGKKTEEQIASIAKLLNFTRSQKNADRLTRLHKTCMTWIYPEAIGDGTYKYCVKVYDPSQYDIIESPTDPEKPAAVIFSDYVDQAALALPLGGGPQVTNLEGVRPYQKETAMVSAGPNAVDVNQKQTFIWWSDRYHFTTDDKGEYIGVGSITPEDLTNPIGMIPGVTSAENQNGRYWATGGQDIVDGAILINTMLTDRNAIMFMQGWGQMVITGQHIPDTFTVGPNHALVLKYDSNKDEAKPEVTVVNSNPPLAEWANGIAQYLAMLLSTNGLSVRSVAVSSDMAQFPSGLAMLIDKSELTESIEDNQQDFYWIEMKEWEVIKRYHNLLHARKLLTADFMLVGALPEKMIVTPKFEAQKTEVVTESERLANMKAKKEIGIVSQLDLIMEENPGMSKEDAQKKLTEIKAEAPDPAPLATMAPAGTINNKKVTANA